MVFLLGILIITRIKGNLWVNRQSVTLNKTQICNPVPI